MFNRKKVHLSIDDNGKWSSFSTNFYMPYVAVQQMRTWDTKMLLEWANEINGVAI